MKMVPRKRRREVRCGETVCDGCVGGGVCVLGEVFIALGRRVCVKSRGMGRGGEEEAGEESGTSLYTYYKLTNRNAPC